MTGASVLVALMLWQAPVAANDDYTRFNQVTVYDHHFSKYGKRYFGVAFDWRYFKAQAVAESGLRADARSSVGAIGLMQITPRTFEEIRQGNPEIAGAVDHPRWNIAAGIWYDRRHFLAWTADRSLVDRLKFMFGSYNAGRQNIRRAQRVAIEQGLDATSWSAIQHALPRVTGRRSGETLAYVARIFDVKQVLR